MTSTVLTYSYSVEEIKGFRESQLAKAEKNDCVVKAIATAARVSYDAAHGFVAKFMNRSNRAGTQTFEILNAMKQFEADGKVSLEGKVFEVKVLTGLETHNRYKLHGEVIDRQKTVKSFIQSHPIGTFLVSVSNHMFTIRDGILIDNKGEEFRPTRKVKAAYKLTDISAVQMKLF